MTKSRCPNLVRSKDSIWLHLQRTRFSCLDLVFIESRPCPMNGCLSFNMLISPRNNVLTPDYKKLVMPRVPLCARAAHSRQRHAWVEDICTDNKINVKSVEITGALTFISFVCNFTYLLTTLICLCARTRVPLCENVRGR